MASPAALALAQVAYGAGFRGQRLVDMVSLGLSESGGNPASLNDNPKTGDYSVGYWQINYYGNLRPGRTKDFGPPEALYGPDPLGPEAQANARAAYNLSGGGQTLSPWQADFNNGSYYKNLPQAADAVQAFLGGAVSPGSVGSPNTVFPVQLLADSSNNPGDSALIPEENKCLIKLPGIGSVCLLNTSQARALLGGLILASGVVVAGLGAALLVSKAVSDSPLAMGAAGTAIAGPEAGAGLAANAKERKLNREIDKGSKATPEQSQQAKDNANQAKGERKLRSVSATDEQKAQWASEGFEAA